MEGSCDSKIVWTFEFSMKILHGGGRGGSRAEGLHSRQYELLM